MTAIDTASSLANLKLERDAIVLYDALASIERDPQRATAFRTIAGNERRHAEVWATKLREFGAEVPDPGAPRLRVRAIIWLARILGTRAVSDLVQALEGDEESAYEAQSSPEVAAIAADEREHAEMWRRLEGETTAPAIGQEMQSQRELYERQIALERAELEMMPDEEQAELAAVYRAKGFTEDEARTIAARLFQDPERALDTLIREELGLDPDQLGSPWGAAGGSFVAFAGGAIIPVVPFLFGGGPTAVVVSIVLSLSAMFAVGVGVSLLTGRSAIFSGFRQVAIGAAAAAVTFAVGRLIGVSVS